MPVIRADGLQSSDGVVFKNLPAGTYPVRITNMELKTSKEKNLPMLEIDLEVSDGEHKEHKLRMWLMIPDKSTQDSKSYQMSVDNLKRVAIACDIDVSSDDFDTDALLHQEFSAVVAVTTKDGKEYNQVKDYLPLE